LLGPLFVRAQVVKKAHRKSEIGNRKSIRGLKSVAMNGDWLQARMVIQNRLGLHARPARAFVDVANGFNADIRVAKGEQEVDGKSIMQMMMLAATQGTELTVKARGRDAEDAIEKLRELVDRKFDEE
jgi:phosphocarrier protein